MKCRALTASRFGLDGGAMFGIVPRPLWERVAPPDASHRIPMAGRALLLEGQGHLALVDVGMGDCWTAKERAIYGLNPDVGIESALSAVGVRPADVTDVVLSHLHFDHCGGLRKATPSGWTPLFPGARHWVQREHWLWAHRPSLRDAGSFRRDDFAWLGTDLAPKLHLVDGAATLWPGVRVHPLYGHSPAMQAVEVESDAGLVVFLADLVPTAAHLPVPWVMGYDVQPLVSVREKAERVGVWQARGATFVFSHDPDIAFATLTEDSRRGWRTLLQGMQLDTLAPAP